MNLAQYRSELQKYHAAVEQRRLEKFCGLPETFSNEAITERFSDLFSLTAISEIHKTLENKDQITETETRARLNLLNAARLGFLKTQTREIDAEFEIFRHTARVSYRNESLTFSEAFSEILSEENTALRREISARVSEAQRFGADLWLEKFDVLQTHANKIGFENCRNLFAEIAGIDFEMLANKAQRFLADTEEIYFRQFADLFYETKSPHVADYLFWRNYSERNKIFSGEHFDIFNRRLLENFGFRAEKIAKVQTVKASGRRGAEFFRPHFPAVDIRFGISDNSGISAFGGFLQIFGKVQQAAWTSENLARQFPEFIFSPDAILSKSYGFLFQILLTEESFLRQNFGLWDEKISRKIARENQFQMLFDIRRDILRLLWEMKFHSAPSLDNVPEFVAMAAQNLGFEFEETDVWLPTSLDFTPAKNLRAMIFAFGLREFLRSRYDFEWWKSRTAFAELIDYWNTAERYRAEEMARMIGFEMSFDSINFN